MKKSLLFLTAALLPIMSFAQEDRIEPDYRKGVYALKISPNGRWLGSMAGDASVHDLLTGDYLDYWTTFLGLGNAVSNTGVAVGESADRGTIMLEGRIVYPKILDKYPFCDINGITPDGKRITGVINNTAHDGLSFVGFVADIDENGELLDEPIMLPHPTKDFFRATPQFATGVWISDDGKAVVGQVTDWRGMYSYPIYYQEDENGNWTYTLPTESWFNPTNIEIPDNPWLSEPPFPEPEDFIMDPVARMAYLTAFEAYSTAGGPYPYPEDYMTEEEYANYVKGVDDYNNWYYGQEQAIKEYIQVYNAVLRTTPSFSSNDLVIDPNGKFFLSHGGREDENGDMIGQIFKISMVGEEWEYINAPERSLFPNQVLTDGTILVTRGIQATPTSYILLPGAEEFITPQEYLISLNHPELAEWMDTTVPYGSGVWLMSDDKSVITGALTPDQLAYFDWEFSDFYYSTYIFNMGTAGIESIVDMPEDGIYKAYNLHGVKVLETKDVTELNNLPKGVYIVNGKKVML